MPIYEYRCPKCGVDYELMRLIGEAEEPALCPQCGVEMKKLLSVFSSKVGFYYRAPDKPALRKPAGKAEDAAPEKGDS